MNPHPRKALLALSKRPREKFLGASGFPDVPGYAIADLDVTNISVEQWRQCLQDEQPEVLIIGWKTPPVPVDIRELGVGLRYICNLAGSVHHIVPRSLIEQGILVTNWGSTISYTIAEHAVLLLMGALRRMPEWKPAMEVVCEQGKMQPKPAIDTRSLRGRRVGIHGFGAIAREIVGMLKGFQVELCAYSHAVPHEYIASHGVRPCSSLEDLFSSVDCIVGCEALSEANTGSVTEDVLRLLPDRAVVVNVGRGRIIDEEALAKVAAEKHLHLGLDVFAQEPPSPDSPLLSLPEPALLTPHIAGPTNDSYLRCVNFACENLRRYAAGEPLDAMVTLDIYDRST